MENASKALLILGGMLLLILALSFSIYLFRKIGLQTSEFYQEINESDISEFNNQFLKYEGKVLNIQDVYSIFNLANNTELNIKMGVRVKVTLKRKNKPEINQDNTDTIIELLKSGENYDKEYTCKTEIPKDSKLVHSVNIEEQFTN